MENIAETDCLAPEYFSFRSSTHVKILLSLLLMLGSIQEFPDLVIALAESVIGR